MYRRLDNFHWIDEAAIATVANGVRAVAALS